MPVPVSPLKTELRNKGVREKKEKSKLTSAQKKSLLSKSKSYYTSMDYHYGLNTRVIQSVKECGRCTKRWAAHNNFEKTATMVNLFPQMNEIVES